MSKTAFILIFGGTTDGDNHSLLISRFKDGISSTPHFDSLDVNKLLLSLEESTPVDDHGLKFSSPDTSVVLLDNPTVEEILGHFEESMQLLPQLICFVYAGTICQSTGHWVLPNALFKPSYLIDRISLISSKFVPTLADTMKETMPSLTIHVACPSVPLGGEWRQVLTSRLPPTIAGRPLLVSVNRLHPQTHKKSTSSIASKQEFAPLPTDLSGVEAFCQQLEAQTLGRTAPAISKVPTNLDVDGGGGGGSCIRIQRPCLYIFPEGSGQCSIFALPGFSFMVNAGYSRDPKCWKMAQHLENIDAILHTHWGIDNTLGLVSLLPVLMASSHRTSAMTPKITCLLTPPPGHSLFGQSPSALSVSEVTSQDSAVINVAKAIGDLAHDMKPAVAESRLVQMEITRGGKLTATPKHVSLYYKTGYGSLDLYPLTPTDEDQTEIKKFIELWSKTAPGITTALSGATAKASATPKHTLATTLASQLSVSALLLWTPARKSDSPLRILFVAPNAHQARILTALEHLHTSLPYIRQAQAYAPTAAAGTTSTVKKPTAPGRPVSTRPSPGNGVPKVSSRPAPRLIKSAATGPSKVALPAAPGKRPQTTRPRQPPTSTTPPTKPSQVATHVKTTSVATKAPSKEKENDADHGETAEPLSEPALDMPLVTVPSPTPSPPVSKSGNQEEHKETRNFEDDLETARIAWDKGDKDAEVSGKGTFSPSTGGSVDGEQEEDSLIGHAEAGETVDGLVASWGHPQAIPPPIAPAAGRNPVGKSTSTRPPVNPTSCEGYFEASTATGGPGKAPYDKMKSIFVDVAFLPGAGDVTLVDAEFFKHLRARYYVCTTVAPTADLLKALIVGKQAWDGDGGAEVSLILAHDTRTFLQWASSNERRLKDANIDLLPVAERSTIQLITKATDGSDDDNGTSSVRAGLSCPGFRLDL